ncbi:MAG TPA: acyltransferase [Nitrospiria bacterium]|nr:acyltransferase [Nitrospiria bacterium]
MAYWRNRLGAFGDGSHIYPHVVIHAPEKVRLGSRVNIAEFVHIWGGGGVEIGNNAIIASHVVITSQTHDTHAAIYRDSQKMMPVYIGAGSWIGAGAIILPGVRIGDEAIVGAQSVVTSDVAPRSVVAGIPARKIERNGEGDR